MSVPRTDAEPEPVAISASDDEALLLAIYPSLRRFAAVVGPSEVPPDDLVHDAIVATLSRGPLSRLNDPLLYLRRTILNLAANHRRRFGRARRAAHLLVAGEADAADHYPSDLADLQALRPEARAVLYLQLVEGMPLPAVAATLGITHNAARQISSRARRALHRSLTEEDS